MTFPEALSAVLSRLDRDAAWLARHTGVSGPTAWSWATGRFSPDRDKIPAIRAALLGSGASEEEVRQIEDAYLGRAAS